MIFFLTTAVYFIEILKYLVGSRYFLGITLKRRWAIIPFALLNFIVAIIQSYTKFDVYVATYLLAGAAAFCMMSNQARVNICQVLAVFFVGLGNDEIMGIILCYILPGTNTYSERVLSIFEGILTVCIFFFIGSIKCRVKWKSSRSINKSAIVLTLFTFFCIILTVTGLESAKRYVPSHYMKLSFDIICMTSYLCMIMLVVFVFYIHEHNKKLEISLNLEKLLKKMQKNNYHMLLERETETRRYRHDMHDHLLYLSWLCDNKEIEKLQKYVGELQEKLANTQKRRYVTGNEIMDLLLNYHLRHLKDVKISVTGQFTRPLNISECDFCAIFSNLILNAAEEVQRQEMKEKYICIDIKQGKIFSAVEMRNSTKQSFSGKEGQLHTNKPDKRNHGIGIINVRETIEKNHGNLVIGAIGNEFTAIVTLDNKVALGV